jgi:phospholipid/cholesterol/gamma-HCH transport system substrate-binding protein
MNKKGIETLVGGFVLLGLLGLVFLALQAANLGSFTNGRDAYTLYARFDNIGGLKPRAPVRSAGVVVGRVTAIDLDAKTYQGVVTLAVDRRYEFPKDSVAKILTAGLLGDQYIGLEPGGDDANIEAGGTIAQTQSAVVLENLIGQLLTGRADEAGTASGAAGAGK